jgi:membrane protein
MELPPGPTARTLRPVTGQVIDPPDRDTPFVRRHVDERPRIAWVWRWWERFRDGRGSLAAKGIAYYAFFALLSGLVLAYAVLAGTSPTAFAIVNRTVEEALPGFVGPEGLDPQRLEATAGRLGVVGAIALVYSALGIIRAADEGVRLVYGLQYDPRPLLRKNLRYLANVVLLLPLFAVSYAGTAAATGLFERQLAREGMEGPVAAVLLGVAGVAVALPANMLLLYLVLTRLTGVVPPRRARAIAAAVGALGFEGFKVVSALVIRGALENPRYLGFGVPLALLIVFFLLATLVLASAALAAVLTETDPVAAARSRQIDSAGGRRVV